MPPPPTRPSPIAYGRDRSIPSVWYFYGRMPIINIGESTKASTGAHAREQTAPTTGEAQNQTSGGNADARLRAMLREAADLRADPSPPALARRRAIWCEILQHELPAIRQQVINAGYKQTGRAWVNQPDIDDVVNEACIRATRVFEQFQGNAPGQLYAALRTCVHYAAIDYVRKDSAKQDDPVDPAAFNPGAHDRDGHVEGHFGPLARLADASSACDRAEFKEQLAGIAELPPRGATVVTMRMAGYKSAEIATELGLTVANVDQIFLRSMRVVMDAAEADGGGER